MPTVRRSRVTAGLISCALLTVAGCTEVAPVPSAASAPSSAPRPTTSAAAPVDSFTLIAGGDVLIHPALTEQATEDGNGKRDYAPLFAGIKPVLDQADLALCHLEVPIATAKGPFKGYPTFYAPPEVATGLADSGFDVCSTASNHTMDQGAEGVATTLDALDEAKIAHTGSARSAAEAAKPLVRDVAGVKVGFVSYTFAFNKGTTRPTPWMANLLDPAAVIAEAKRAREAGAEVVVASIHWGTEGKHEPNADQRKIAQRLLGDPSIDVIIGHHAHVVQPFERINGKWVTYGLGNQVAKHEEPKGTTEEGVLARFRFVKSAQGWTVDKAEYLPTLVDLGPPIRLRDLTSDTEVSAARKEQAIERTDGVVLSRDAATDGLTRPGG
ncbi:poly-gamma-glutamate synthesis protein (capsule biosynthesis protein) [Actinokineospora alba]|uniref:Poly-gamma-glutamate synthesis protein (Capsule biosynthesis protein) n=1 Tax=Actinokineospora alba TaxID=504798 RepID=A0A1H0PC43_9PSEU|nr:poly-gamma-glutamate synthesis protein (capsule biosynthesis protein) [Actinokineospora alba]SDI66327.1 poly-gamma-glutamate synthesis protein (capsule biosynthesis protein) [Actinokineospora alba]SDP02571.1 poly-gamma-glutamate synthesis protein (capsule biosynthesis protein) [Actinokineospora alba]